MKNYSKTFKASIRKHKKELTTTVIFLIGAIVLIGSIILFVQNSQTKIVYQPTEACKLLTLEEARDLMGPKTIRTRDGSIKITANGANSECGYTNGDPDMYTMVVAALIVRSGVNDKGVEKNKADFAASRPESNVETVPDIGDSAYFNHDLGQLNILDGKEWIILSYGVGQTPETNTVEQAVEMARKIIR